MTGARFVVQSLLGAEDPVDLRVDAVELRLDLYPGLDVEAFVARSPRPVVASVRRARDGGAHAGSEAARGALLRRAAKAAYVDLELDANPALAPRGPLRIVSLHDPHGMPADLDALFERCLLTGAHRVKIAVTPASAAEAFRLLDLPTPGLGMGGYGAFTRVLAPLTYCGRRPLAPGMPTPEELFDLYAVRRLGAATALFGVAGDPIDHSMSPALHNPALVRDRIDAVYLPFRVADLAEFWPAFLAHRGQGLSITAPLKLQAARLAARPDEDVLECGAANTLLADGRACNTDVRAFLDLLPRGRREALVLGAGGAARAAVAALRRLGHDVAVWARRPGQAAALGAKVVSSPHPSPIVVNTTSLEPPPSTFLVDLRYGPGIAPPASGIGGLEFLRAQARHQYRTFFGRDL
ncbi:MAG: type I 3-dehydroquinate dehydratase [Planctomycetaceae bacterium]